MKRISSTTTGLSPVLKKPSPTKKDQEKIKEGAKQEQPWIVQVGKKNYKQELQTTNNTYKQQLLTSTVTYSSAFSSVPPLSRPVKMGQDESVIPPEGSRPEGSPDEGIHDYHIYGVCRRESTPDDIDPQQ
jgi:hypothetical protein